MSHGSGLHGTSGRQLSRILQEDLVTVSALKTNNSQLTDGGEQRPSSTLPRPHSKPRSRNQASNVGVFLYHILQPSPPASEDKYNL